jgi:hypothetical protein
MEDSKENFELPEELRKMMLQSLYIDSSFPALSNSMASGNSENSPKYEFNFCQDTDSNPDSGLLKKKGFQRNTAITDQNYDFMALDFPGTEGQNGRERGSHSSSNGPNKKKSVPGFTLEVNQYLQ